MHSGSPTPTDPHRHVVSKRTFGCVDYSIFSSLWKWARRRHPNKSPRWFKPKYFAQRGNRDWSFFGETCDDEGQTNKVWLYYAKSTPIKRHVKVKGEANPHDPTYETYFEEREGAHMLETFRGTRTLRQLWYEQRGLCTLCHTKITPDHRLAASLLRLPCDGWFGRCDEPRFTSSRVP